MFFLFQDIPSDYLSGEIYFCLVIRKRFRAICDNLSGGIIFAQGKTKTLVGHTKYHDPYRFGTVSQS